MTAFFENCRRGAAPLARAGQFTPGYFWQEEDLTRCAFRLDGNWCHAGWVLGPGLRGQNAKHRVRASARSGSERLAFLREVSDTEIDLGGRMARATGIGGFFFRADNPEALRAWYAEHLGISGPPWMQAAGPTVFEPFQRDDLYFPTSHTAMINLRVDDLDALKVQLEAAGISVETRADWDSEIGRFARIHDPEGNPIELWQPPAE